jgi:hypothetical protein
MGESATNMRRQFVASLRRKELDALRPVVYVGCKRPKSPCFRVSDMSQLMRPIQASDDRANMPIERARLTSLGERCRWLAVDAEPSQGWYEASNPSGSAI